MSTIAIAGGTGMIGKALSLKLAQRGHSVYVFSRSFQPFVHENIHISRWDVMEDLIDLKVINDSHVVVNLAGTNIAEGRWTNSRKNKIINSRVKSTELLVNQINRHSKNLVKYIGGSAIGYYGHQPDKIVDEETEAGKGFLSKTCLAWENAIQIINPSVKIIKLRTGVVLSNQGGAFPKMKKGLPFVSPYFGNGKQSISWIHIEDMVNLMVHIIEQDLETGAYNAVAPNSCSSKQLAQTLAKYSNGIPLVLPIPSFILKLMLGEMSSTVLDSLNVSSDKIEKTGFQFLYPKIEPCIKSLLKK
jgi:uncharacterized protein (TIGR01777 family)